jgi:putative inorganic carbon (HCO3(-)) transporter
MALALVPLIAAMVVKADGAVVVFAGAFYLNVPVVLVHQVGAPSALASAVAALLLLPFFGYVIAGRQPLVVTPALGCMVGYLAVLTLSATLAPGAGTQTTGELTGFVTEGLLLYLLITNALRTTRTLRLVLWAVAVAAGVMGLISVWQELTHSYSNHLFGFAEIDQSGFDVAGPAGTSNLRPRMAGPIGEKNRYAQVLIVVLPLAVYLARSEARRWLRVAALAAGALTLCGMMLSFSRGAALALVATIVVAGLVGAVRARYVAALLVGIVALALIVAPDYITRVQSLGAADSALSSNSTADGAVVGRATENIAALHAFADHPILGVGPGQYFRQYSQEYANALNLRFLDTNRRAHNLYLEIAADTGAIGLLAFLAIVVATLTGLWRVNVIWRRRHPPHARLALAMLLAVFAYMASGVFLQLAYQRYFYFLLALANAGIWILRREALWAGLLPGMPQAGPQSRSDRGS